MFDAFKKSKIITVAKHFCYRFAANRKGIASIEFAVILPMMVLIFMASFELSHALTINRRVHQVAGVTADVVARTTSFTTSELDTMIQSIDVIVEPYSNEPLSLSATHVVVDTNNPNNAIVCWSYSNKPGVAIPTQGSIYTLPDGLARGGEGLVIVEGEYIYQPALSIFLQQDIPFRERLFLTTRNSQNIGLDGTTCQ